jgi:hypothetical protein
MLVASGEGAGLVVVCVRDMVSCVVASILLKRQRECAVCCGYYIIVCYHVSIPYQLGIGTTGTCGISKCSIVLGTID